MAFTPPSLASETIFHLGEFPIRNSMVMGWLAMAVLIVGALIFKAKGGKLVPKGFQNLVEVLIGGLFDFFNSVTQDKAQTRRFFPVVTTIFLFVIMSNWMGIFPGVGPIGIWEEEHVELTAEETAIWLGETTAAHTEEAAEAPVTEETFSDEDEVFPANEEEPKMILVPLFRSAYADVNMTLALAIISVVMTQFYGIFGLGFFHYAGKFIVNPFRDPIGFFVGLLELVSEFAKMISFSFRLFGNIFAGEVLLLVIGFLAPYIAPLPFYGLEIFVGFVQALVFALLTLVFMKGAVTSHSEAAH